MPTHTFIQHTEGILGAYFAPACVVFFNFAIRNLTVRVLAGTFAITNMARGFNTAGPTTRTFFSYFFIFIFTWAVWPSLRIIPIYTLAMCRGSPALSIAGLASEATTVRDITQLVRIL